jgi:ABC-2 type transport system ATP-binding protein
MDDNTAIRVENLSKTFKLPLEKSNSIKSAVVNFYRRNKTYELQEALKNVSFEVKKGEFFGVVGRNGSGKSTLLKILAGIYTPSLGGVTVNGRLIPFIELGVGFSPELSGRDNVFLNGALLGFSRKEMQAMYKSIVEFAEIERFMDQKLKNYSSGMQVRLAFSIAIRAKSDILLLDEVLAVGDAAFQQKCFNYFEDLKQQKKTVVFVTHDMSAVKRFCTRAIYVKDGKLIKVGSPFEVADIYVEENMDSAQEATKRDKPTSLSNACSITARVSEQTDNKLLLRITYKSENKEKMYVGISIIKDGISVAEISTAPDMPLVSGGEITYSLDTSIFNEGVYFIDAALFRLENRELLSSIHSNKVQFIVKGHDITKGAALKLADAWEYKRAG